MEPFEGLLRVSSSDWFGAHCLAPVFAEFAQMHPGVVVELLTCQLRFSLPRREADLVSASGHSTNRKWSLDG